MSELGDFQNNPNKLSCFVESHETITSYDLTHQSYVIKQTQRLEAKCRATVNQHLQTALDNSGTLFRSNYVLLCFCFVFLGGVNYRLSQDFSNFHFLLYCRT